MMARSGLGWGMVALGIDIGTSSARVALFRAEEPELIQFPDGAHNVPAVVAMGQDAVRVGRVALGRAATHPDQTVRGIKRLLGRTVDDPVVERVAATAAFGVEADGEGALRLRLKGEPTEPEQVAAALLGHLAEVVEQQTGEQPDRAVLTTPYWYGPRQRQALTEAARRAGLATLQVLSEATATALSLLTAEQGTRLVAIVDVGAGGCTASVLEMGPRKVQLAGSAGDPLGGGEDVDRGLVRAVVKGLKQSLGDFSSNPAVDEMLRQACEGAKKDLPTMASVTAVVPFLPIGTGLYNQQVIIERDSFQLLLDDTEHRLAEACRRAVDEAGIAIEDLAAVYATGGMMRLPSLRARVEQVLGPIASRRIDPDGAVALGAAYQAGMLAGAVESIPVLDVQTAMSLPPPLAGPAESLPPAQIHTAPPGRTDSAPVERIQVESFKMELAGLLASMRAGALTQADQKQKRRRVVARVSEVVEDELAPGSDLLAERLVTLRTIWQKLAVVIQTARQYRWSHPQTDKALGQALELVEAALADEPISVRWDVGTMHFSHAGEPIYQPDRPPFDRIPYELFVAGIRKVQFRPGLTTGELREFLGVLLQDAALGFSAEDDAATALWDRKLEHIAYLAVDAFAEGDDPTFEQHRDEIARELAKLAAMSDEGEDLLGAYAEIHREVLSDVAEELEKKMAETLGHQLDLPEQQWLGRFALGFVAAYEDAAAQGDVGSLLDTLAEWSREQVAARAPQAAFGALATLTEAFTASRDRATAHAFRSQAVAAMFPSDELQQVCADLAPDPTPDPTVLGGVRLALDLLGDDSFFDPALELYGSAASDELREALLSYLAHYATGHEQQIAQLLTTATADHALQLLDRLRGLGGPAAVGAVTAAFASRHTDVRLAALGYLPLLPPQYVVDELRKILDDREDRIRRKALEAIAEQGLESAIGPLTERIRADEFHERPLRERRLIIEALGKLDRTSAERLSIELLQKQQLFRADTVEQTRSIAADFLATSDSEEALEALSKAAKSRFYASSELRVTAKRAADAVVQRRSLRPPPGGKPR